MTAKERFIKALNNEKPDRLPVTTHHVMEYYLNKYLHGVDDQEFFDRFHLDPILWLLPLKANEKQFFREIKPGMTQILSEEWIIEAKEIPNQNYRSFQYGIITPSGNLSTVLQNNEYTTWVAEHLIKNKNDIDIIMKHAPFCEVDRDKVNTAAQKFGSRGLVRGHIPGFELFGQPGCWQDMACLFGIENLILATFDDPQWIHTFLRFLRDRKLHFADSLKDVEYDLLELGGGDASTTVISPDIFQNFVAPYDSDIIASAKRNGQKIAYHTCGGMMPILEDICNMGPAAIETLTPSGMGGDVDLAEVKRRVGDRVCLIGGFDQGEYFMNSSEKETRKAVREAFEAAGEKGGFILSPSDHFFDAKPELLQAFADEARKCTY